MVMSLRHYAEFLPPAGPPPQAPPANLALNSLGVTALASSTYSGGPSYVALNAYDADDTSSKRWNSDLNDPVGEWLGVDLTAVKHVTKFRLMQFTAGSYTFAPSFKIQSADNSAFTTNLVDRHTYTGAGRGTTGTGAGEQDTGLVTLDTPGDARYWRVLALTSTGSPINGWGVYTFELHGVDAVIPSQSLVLPALSDSDTLYPPTITQGPAPTVLVLPKISDGDTLLPPTVTQGPAPQPLVLPKLSDSDTLYPPTVTVGPGPQNVVLPKLTDPDTLRPPSVIPGASQLTLPLLSDPDILLAPTVVPGATTLTLPLLLSTATLRPPAVHLGLFPVNAEVQDRVYDSAGPSRVRYVWGQTLEVRLTFTDTTGYAADPSTVVLEYQMPDGTEVSYTYGTDTELGRLDTGIYRIQLTPDQSGRWFYRGEGITLGIHAAAEGSFIIRPSEFDPDHTPPVETP